MFLATMVSIADLTVLASKLSLAWARLIFLPALAVLASGLGDLYAWAPTSQLVATINLVAVFLGALIQKSSLDYWKKGGDDHGTGR